MRHKSRTVLAALVAVLALGAVASASASAALPEFVPSSGGFGFTLEGSSPTAQAEFQNSSGIDWAGSCRGVKTKGDITGAKVLSLTIELENCQHEGNACESKGAGNEHEILSGSASLVYISKTEKRVGILFTPTPTEVSCGINTKIRGNLIIPVTPINTKTSSLGFVVQGILGRQEFKTYENEGGELKSAKLEWNVGAGYAQADLDVEGELKLTASKALTVEG